MDNKGVMSLVNIILALIVISILGGLGYLAWNTDDSFVPENFSKAREQSVNTISGLVLDLDDSLSKSLVKISEEDRAGRFSSALQLVKQEIVKMEKIKNASFELSDELVGMAQAIQGIRPTSASTLAFEAVSEGGYAILVHLNNYSNFFNELLATLEKKFVDDSGYDGSDVQGFIDSMNKEGEEINSAISLFNQKLAEFDKSL